MCSHKPSSDSQPPPVDSIEVDKYHVETHAETPLPHGCLELCRSPCGGMAIVVGRPTDPRVMLVDIGNSMQVFGIIDRTMYPMAPHLLDQRKVMDKWECFTAGVGKFWHPYLCGGDPRSPDRSISNSKFRYYAYCGNHIGISESYAEAWMGTHCSRGDPIPPTWKALGVRVKAFQSWDSATEFIGYDPRFEDDPSNYAPRSHRLTFGGKILPTHPGPLSAWDRPFDPQRPTSGPSPKFYPRTPGRFSDLTIGTPIGFVPPLAPDGDILDGSIAQIIDRHYIVQSIGDGKLFSITEDYIMHRYDRDSPTATATYKPSAPVQTTEY